MLFLFHVLSLSLSVCVCSCRMFVRVMYSNMKHAVKHTYMHIVSRLATGSHLATANRTWNVPRKKASYFEGSCLCNQLEKKKFCRACDTTLNVSMEHGRSKAQVGKRDGKLTDPGHLESGHMCNTCLRFQPEGYNIIIGDPHSKGNDRDPGWQNDIIDRNFLKEEWVASL